jgi:hypothetical protein
VDEFIDILGRRVAMNRDWFISHIVGKRGFMVGWESEVESALTQPDRITFDKDFANRECFYRTGNPLSSTTYLKVVVEFDNEDSGKVITAYPTHIVPAKERHKWP